MKYDFAEIKAIPIMVFLERLGVRPVRNYTDYALYHAPYRKDIHPSFKVSKKKNRWYDLATMESGDIIDLGKLIYGTTDIITVIERMHVHDGRLTVRDHTRKEKIKEDPFAPFMDVKALPLAARPLLSYLTSRAIDVEIAVRYCVEIHYRLGLESIMH